MLPVEATGECCRSGCRACSGSLLPSGLEPGILMRHGKSRKVGGGKEESKGQGSFPEEAVTEPHLTGSAVGKRWAEKGWGQAGGPFEPLRSIAGRDG